MKNARKEKRRKKRRAMSQAMLIILLMVMSLATDGFGAVPPSQFSENFREQLGEALPSELVEEINQYLTGVNTVNIPVQVVDVVEEAKTASSPSFFSENFLEFLSLIFPPEVFDTIYEITTPPFGFPDANNMPSQAESILLPEEIAQTLVVSLFTTGTPATFPTADVQRTAAALSNLTPSAIPTSIFTPSPTLTASPSPSPTIIWYPWTLTPTEIPWTLTPTEIPNRAPVCAGFNYSDSQTTGILTIDLAPQCSDPDGDFWALTSVTQGANGSTTFSSSSIFYDPDNGFAGTDSITFTIDDGNIGGVYTQAFIITISNLAPTANADATIIFQDSGANLIDVLANDTDPGNDTLTITNLTQGTSGTVLPSVGADTLSYTPNAGFTGADSFTYSAADPYGGISASTTVNVNVIPITIYRPNSYDGGSLGDRSNTKALCASALPSGYTNYQAFIGYSAADSIANMPSNYGVPTNLKIQSPNGTIIANNWADLLDGTIIISLRDAGIPASAWWSGAESADGTHIDGVTNNCDDWTDNNADGQLGSLFSTDSQWMVSSISACSPQDWTLLCIAYP